MISHNVAMVRHPQLMNLLSILERAAAWNRWIQDGLLMQLTGYLRR